MRIAPTGYVDVGRTTIFGNPYRIGARGPDGKLMSTAASTIPHFTAWAQTKMSSDPHWASEVRALSGKKLWCPGCGTSSPTCHARVLEQLALTQP